MRREENKGLRNTRGLRNLLAIQHGIIKMRSINTW